MQREREKDFLIFRKKICIYYKKVFRMFKLEYFIFILYFV